jgi:hypothetical protein
MTIEYQNKPFPPPPFDQEMAIMQYFRDLYDGNHAEIFPRAQTLHDPVVRQPRRKQMARYQLGKDNRFAMFHYIVVNFASVIAELPADLINRALGNISADKEEGDELDFVEAVVKKSAVKKKLWPSVVQHQVDGGVAYRIRRNDAGEVWFEWKPADMYFPHDDESGADITWIEQRGKEKFLRVERQQITPNGLRVSQHVFSFEGESTKEEIDIQEYASRFNLTIPMDIVLEGVSELMCGYVANDDTLLVPRGRSALRNIDTIQEEINWTITRDSIVFEKHGKPKLAIPKGLWDSVAQTNQARYGERFVRNADLEVVSYNENNGAVPLYITWNAMTEQSFEHVKRLVKQMMAVSKTSLQAVGLEADGGQKSAVALLYEWIQSVIKAEAIKDKFDAAIKEAIRKCIVLQNALGRTSMEEKEPVIEWMDMLPKAKSERDTEEASKYEKGVQSLETTVRNIHPDWSEKAIQAEIEKIEEEKTVDSFNPTFTQPPKVSLGDDPNDLTGDE